MRLFRKISCPKVLLWTSNIALLGLACALLAAGVLLYMDNQRILISKLLGATNEILFAMPKPLFFYVAIALAGAGLVCLFAGILGLWANCWSNCFTLTLNFLVVFLLLIGEFVFSISISIWPQCLGLNVDEQVMANALKEQYGIPGHEAFTAAIDLVQTQFNCCGINTDNDYDYSFWRLQAHGNGLTVPLTCCLLEDTNDAQDSAVQMRYLDPKPRNLTLCQSVNRKEIAKGRHSKSCLPEIQYWYQQHYLAFLGILFVIVLVHFFVLLTIIYRCTHIKRQRQESINQHMAEFERKVNDRRNIIAASSTGSSPIPTLTDGRDSILLSPDYNTKPRNVTSFQRTGNQSNRMDYRSTKAYLV